MKQKSNIQYKRHARSLRLECLTDSLFVTIVSITSFSGGSHAEPDLSTGHCLKVKKADFHIFIEPDSTRGPVKVLQCFNN